MSSPSRSKARGKKVEFSPTLDPIDSEAQLTASALGPALGWDTETGGESHGASYTSEQDVPTFASSSDFHSMPMPPTSATSSSNPSPSSFIEEDDDDEPIQPATPAVQFYSHSVPSFPASHNTDHAAGATMTSGSSSSSLSSMAAALVSGGPVMYQQMQQQNNHPGSCPPSMQPTSISSSSNNPGTASPSGHLSPLSPAGLIGTGHENLMLPPPGRMTSDSGNPTGDQARHLQWLSDLNARAKAAASMHAANAAAAAASSNNSSSVPPGTVNSMGPPLPQVQGMQHQVYSSSLPAAAPPPHDMTNSAGQQHQQQAMMPGYPTGPLLAPMPAMMYAQVAHMQHLVTSPVATQAETEEKRAKRLERNRESARKSRRRKKERLATLEAQVNKLQNKIDVERKKRIHVMIPSLTVCRGQAIAELMQTKGDFATSADLVPIIRNTGANSQISVVVTDFQYATLRYMLLPMYHKLLLWLTLHAESFFIVGKEEYLQREANKQVNRPTTGRISSKQIGDELVNVPKGKADSGPGLTGTEDMYDGDQPSQSSYANDAPRFWPLFCYWLSFSVDQEDRLLTAQKKIQQRPGLAESRAQMVAAQRTTERLKGAVESLCSVVSQREEQSYLSILTPTQVAKYHDWLAANRERCRIPLQDETPTAASKDTSLAEICRKLDELQISKAR